MSLYLTSSCYNQDRLHPYLRSKYFIKAPLSAAFDDATVAKMNNVSINVFGESLGQLTSITFKSRTCLM